MSRSDRRQLGLLALAAIGLTLAGWNLWRLYGPKPPSQPAPPESFFAVLPVHFDADHADVVSAGEATGIPDGEYVIGIEVNGAAKAYPISVMGLELANDMLGGEPIAVSW